MQLIVQPLHPEAPKQQGAKANISNCLFSPFRPGWMSKKHNNIVIIIHYKLYIFANTTLEMKFLAKKNIQMAPQAKHQQTLLEIETEIWFYDVFWMKVQVQETTIILKRGFTKQTSRFNFQHLQTLWLWALRALISVSKTSIDNDQSEANLTASSSDSKDWTTLMNSAPAKVATLWRRPITYFHFNNLST